MNESRRIRSRERSTWATFQRTSRLYVAVLWSNHVLGPTSSCLWYNRHRPLHSDPPRTRVCFSVRELVGIGVKTRKLFWFMIDSVKWTIASPTWMACASRTTSSPYASIRGSAMANRSIRTAMLVNSWRHKESFHWKTGMVPMNRSRLCIDRSALCTSARSTTQSQVRSWRYGRSRRFSLH